MSDVQFVSPHLEAGGERQDVVQQGNIHRCSDECDDNTVYSCHLLFTLTAAVFA